MAFELDRLRDKAGRYGSHNSFLENVSPKILFQMVLNLSLNQQTGITMNNSYSAGTINYNRFR